MGTLWVVFFVALTGSHFGYGLPIGSTPQTYPYDGSGPADSEAWGQSGLYAALPALALLITAVGLLFGCTWCYRHKDCKPNQGEDNQLFASSVTQHLHDGRRSNPPDSGFSEPANNNAGEDNNNGPISLREMQNIANNNAAAYIASGNEQRNRLSQESVVEFEPLPVGIGVADPLERHTDWFGGEDFSRNRLQYLREIGRGWFGRVVEGEIEDGGATSTVAVKILNQNASLEDKARFLEESRVYRDITHENVLAYVAKCLQEDPWILLFELCPMDLQQYLVVNRHKMAMLNESGVPLRLMCDVSSALAHLHSRGHLYGDVWSGSVLVRGEGASARAVLGRYAAPPTPEYCREGTTHTVSGEVWSLGTLVWQVCAWGAAPTTRPPPLPDLPCPYRNHLYQVMQLCWNPTPEARPTAAQVYALINHLYTTHTQTSENSQDDGYGSSDFEERWQRLKPNSIPVVDEHIALVHAPSTSVVSQFSSDRELGSTPTVQDSLSVDIDTAVSRSSSIMSDKDPLSVQIKSESLTNLHGSLEDVRNIYLTHNEMAVLECHQGNISLDDTREREHDRSDSSVDPWLKDIMAGSQDDVSYYKDVSDVIKNLDNILNSEKTSSSESSHQASPSRDNLSLDCKKDYPMQSSMVKSPGISNFQNILEAGFVSKSPELEPCDEDDVDRDTLGTLSHSYERHSDTISQQTLENLTPETPLKDFDATRNIGDQNDSLCHENLDKSDNVSKTEQKQCLPYETELPNESKIVSFSEIPKLREMCVASIPSVSKTNNELTNETQDCLRSCDNNLAPETTDKKIETKSIDDVEHGVHSTQVENTTKSEEVAKDSELELENTLNILPTQETSTAEEPIPLSESDRLPEIEAKEDTLKSLTNTNKMEAISTSGHITPPEPSADVSKLDEGKGVIIDSHTLKLEDDKEVLQSTAPETVQNVIIHRDENINSKPNDQCEPKLIEAHVTEPTNDPSIQPQLSTETIQNANIELPAHGEEETNSGTEKLELPKDEIAASPQPEVIEEIEEHFLEQSNNSTAYLDLMDNSNETLKETPIDDDMKSVIKSCFEMSNAETTCMIVKNESTVYMDLPSMIKETDSFLQSERIVSSQNVQLQEICSSTPIGSDHSTDNTLENSVKPADAEEPENLCETKVPEYGLGPTMTKSEQKHVPDSMSPFESPTKSHHTDTYDENSSVVLGPFENCSLELFKGFKSLEPIEAVDLPKEELLAFSSNFSEMNLETPSPLRDVNFLNEVPDIILDDIQFDDIETLSEQIDKSEARTENTNESDHSATEKRVSPSTPPNSPGIFLASTTQHKYSIVDIDLDPPGQSNDGLPREVDLNQIELQITTKLAMAENENNLNIEYSGPLTVEGVISDETMVLHESDGEGLQDSYLAGNGGSSPRASVEIDEECVKALRNELELKLPLAQVANIEPESESGEWGGALPPPPELVVSYPGALSPIAEETRQQLSAYDNDANWSTRTESSESYPEPCNNSTDEVTDLATGLDPATYTVNSSDHDYRDHEYRTNDHVHDNHDNDHGNDRDHDRTYTLQTGRDADTSREVTMSADSLNGSPYKKQLNESPIDDRTYNKHEDEKESKYERISQVSPCILSPTTETSAPDNTDGVTTLSKTTVPTDAKSSKPSETHCLSKATSIDSWCSNDTLYNVEENFDDLAMDPDLPLDFDAQREDENSESSNTLTHNDDDKELSHCSTYIVHDSKSEACETFSPDSITANDNYTYTKARNETAAASSALTKSDVDSTKNTQTKDLAYGTLMSGMPSYSNCTTEVASGFDDVWKLQQPEMVRRSPITDEINITPPKFSEEKDCGLNESPQTTAPCLKKMDSVEISCLHDNLLDTQPRLENPENQNILIEITESPNCQYKNMAPSVTSTPLTDTAGGENVEAISMQLPDTNTRTPEFPVTSLPNFQTFLQSAEVRPQDISPTNEGSSQQDTEILLEGDSKTLSRISNRDSLAVTDHTPTINYSDFENSAITKPQDVQSTDKSSQSMESGISSDEFRNFENSVRNRPQDLSSVIDASASLLNSERRFCDMVIGNSTSVYQEQTSQNESRVNNCEPSKSLDVSPPNDTNLIESQDIGKIVTPKNFYIDLDVEDETEQPHSIIITERDVIKESPNRTYDSHTDAMFLDLNHTYDSHETRYVIKGNVQDRSVEKDIVQLNGIDKEDGDDDCEKKMPKPNDFHATLEQKSPKEDSSESLIISPEVALPNVIEPMPSKSEVVQLKHEKVKCNGKSEKFATVQFLHETFEELIESNVDDGDCKPDDCVEETNGQVDEIETPMCVDPTSKVQQCPAKEIPEISKEDSSHSTAEDETTQEDVKTNGVIGTDEEKLTSVTENFLQNEKKFCQLDAYFPLLSDIRFTGPAAEIMSTSFSQESPTEATSPECERDCKTDAAADILKEWDSDSDSHSTNSSSGEFIWKQRENGQCGGGTEGGANDAASASGDSGSGSEGDEVEFVPSSWDCRAAPAKSSLRSLDATPDSKKRVVFKRQKYHCVYEYPREVAVDVHSPAAYMPDLSTYSDWDPSSAEEAELGYGQLFGAPSPLDLYPLRSGIAYDYDEDFFISSSTRPFESLGIMSTSSQFFPGMYAKAGEGGEGGRPPPPTALDLTTPDSGVEDITPSSATADDDYRQKCWSGSDSVTPSPTDALGGLRHTRDRLKLDLPPSPRDPKHSRVFNFVLEPPRRPSAPPSPAPTPAPTFATFGKGSPVTAPAPALLLAEPSPAKPDADADSGDDDSGIESSSKATLERTDPASGQGQVNQ